MTKTASAKCSPQRSIGLPTVFKTAERRSPPHFRSVLWCPGSVIRSMRRTLAANLRHRRRTRALGILGADLGAENAGGFMLSPALLASLAELVGLRATLEVVISIAGLTVVLSLGLDGEKKPT